MKWIVILMLLPFALLSQEDSGLVTRNRPGLFWFFNGNRPIQDADSRKYDRCIVEITHNEWFGDLNVFQNKWNSLGYHFSINKDIQLKSTNRVTFGIGMGYSYLNHTLDRVFFNTQHESVDTELPSPTDSMIYSKLTMHQFYIPLELRLKSSGWKHVKLILGTRVGIQPWVFSKSLYKENGIEQYYEQKLQDVGWFYSTVYARFGIRNWSIVGLFHPMKLFNLDESVRLYPFQIGISLSLF